MTATIRPIRLASPALQVSRVPSLAEQAADILVTGISSGALQPGQRLFEVELASQLKMSRVPLREALKILEAQGIVESAPHRGARVALFGDERVTQICQARIALERLALADAVPRFAANPALSDRLDQIILRMEGKAAQGDWIEVSKADLDFHREILRIAENEIVAKLWESLARHVFIVFGHEIRDERDAAVIGPQHRRIRDLLLTGDLASLNAEIERHIMRLRSQPERRR
ncbi:MAG: GntR family transcriptional regulator [Hyphomicrobiales bacterium]|jgi:DNA-binding GntR family transcriptional regulator